MGEGMTGAGTGGCCCRLCRQRLASGIIIILGSLGRLRLQDLDEAGQTDNRQALLVN